MSVSPQPLFDIRRVFKEGKSRVSPIRVDLAVFPFCMVAELA